MDDVELGMNRDEVIQDSEDEGLSGLKNDLETAFFGALSPEPELDAQDTTSWQAETSTSVNASSSRTGVDNPPRIDLKSVSEGASTSKPRPKPRPINKSKLPNDAHQSVTGDLHDAPGPGLEYQGYMSSFQVDMLPGSIADRAKMRQRKSKSTTDPIDASAAYEEPRKSVYSEIIELTDEEDDFIIQPAKKKTKQKPIPKTKKSLPNPLIDPDTATTSSIPTEPKPKARPKPRPIKRKVPLSPLPFPDPISQPTTNIPTSSLQAPIPFALAPSQFLHSDPPPPPTSTPPPDLPRIETLPNPPTDGPLSSPSSLFSVFDFDQNKNTGNVDELESDHGHAGVGMDVDDETARAIGPPPTFFAPSSSLAEGNGGTVPPGPAAEAIDLTMLPPAMVPAEVVTAKAKKTPKPRKPRKKKGDDVPVGDEADIPKKAKPKPRAKKSSKLQVEVFIPLPAPNSKGKEKEVFKSSELISDTDDDELNLVPPPPLPAVGNTSEIPAPASIKPNSLSSLSSIRDSEEWEDVIKPASRKRKSVANEDGDVGNSTSPKKKAKGKRKDTKRKPAVISDTEDEFADAVVASAKTAKAKGKGKKQNTLIFDSDEEEAEGQDNSVIYAQTGSSKPDDTRPDTAKVSKAASKKGKRKNVVQDDEDGVTDPPESVINDVPSEEMKENLSPPPKSKSSPTTAIPASSSAGPSNKPDPAKKEPHQYSSLTSRYTIAPRTKSTPMSQLIQKVNSLPGSPFRSPTPALVNKRPSMLAYSPYLKSSRSMLSKIAPLHPNRRTPPPPLPPPPPRKKTKKELEMEERWEEELVESVGGITEWACMTDEERKAMRKAKREREMYGWDD